MFPFLNPDISYFAETNFREERKLFGMYQKDRLFHTAIFGKTGVGKTTLIETLILQDIVSNRGIFLVDIHGDMSTSLLKQIPENRKKDLVYINLSDSNLQWKYNPLRTVPYEKRSLVASHILDTLKKLWSSAWGPKLEHILRYVLLSLLDQPTAHFSDIIRILQNPDYRDVCISNLVSDELRNFWEKEFKNYKPNDLIPIFNKIGAFLAHPAVKKLLISNTKELRLGTVMNSQKICILRIAKGDIGQDASFLLSSLFINSFASASFSRVMLPENTRKPFFIYLDEYPSYMTPNIGVMLSELRKFKVGLILACQHLSMIEPKLKEAILGNVGTTICFRLGFSDANYFTKEFHPIFQASDFTNLSNYEIYLRLFILGKASVAFSARTLRYADIFL